MNQVTLNSFFFLRRKEVLLGFLLEAVKPFTLLSSFPGHYGSLPHYLFIVHPSIHPFIYHPFPSFPPSCHFSSLQTNLCMSGLCLPLSSQPPEARFPGLFQELIPAGINSRSPPHTPGLLDLLHIALRSWREAQICGEGRWGSQPLSRPLVESTPRRPGL